MNIKAAILFTSLTLFFINSNAQEIDSVLDVFANQFTPEKVHVHFDRSNYNSGETIYYKVYVLANDHLSSLSKIVYVDWYDPTGKLVQQHELPLILSSGKGSFEVPADYAGNMLHVKVYTKWMLNFDTSFIYSCFIRVKQPIVTQSVPQSAQQSMPVKMQGYYTTQVQLYPEGGFAIAGLQNKFAYQALNQFGKPVSLHGYIKNSEGRLLDSTATVHAGMGAFSLVTEINKTYSFDWTDEYGNTGSTAITAQKQTGATIRLVNKGGQVSFAIERTADAGESFKTMHLLIHRNEALHYKLDINMSAKAAISSKVALAGLPPGIVQFTLFNTDWVPVAERVIFLHNRQQFFYPKITISKKDLTKKGENEIDVTVADTTLTNMSVAITDADMADAGGAGIFADLLLSNEIKGRVNNPGYYFSTVINHDTIQGEQQLKTDSIIASHLDLVMLTHGHRLYHWDKIAKGVLPQFKYPADTTYLQLKGKVKAKTKGELLLNVMLMTKDSSRSMFAIPVKKDGSFEQSPLIFYDSAKLFTSLNGKKGFGNATEVIFENTLLGRQERANFFANKKVPRDLYVDDNDVEKQQTDSLLLKQAYARKLASSATLKEVIVKAKTKTRIQVLNDYYTSGMFAGQVNSYDIDAEGDIHSRSAMDLFTYIQSKVPGFRVEYQNGAPIPTWYPDATGIPGVPAFMLDEVPISLSTVYNLSMSSIAYIKAIRPPFLGTMLNGFSGVIALYSTRGYSPIHDNENEAGLPSQLLSGFTKFREFIQPSYNDSTPVTEADYRPTLYWNPYVLTSTNNQHVNIKFFNNDISKKICIILEGINAEGKMARVVKVID